MIWLKIIAGKRMCDIAQVQAAIAGCDELAAMFVRSTKTADEDSRKDINIHQTSIRLQRVESPQDHPPQDILG